MFRYRSSKILTFVSCFFKYHSLSCLTQNILFFIAFTDLVGLQNSAYFNRLGK